jgi:RNA polymerase sigma factor (sigma-70 family)
MNGGHLRAFIQRLQQFAGGPTRGLADAELLERWLTQRDQAVFEVLVWRHGTLVLNVCQRVLRREQDVEDAFQATFLVLLRKASAIGKRESVGSWLHKVAYRIALEAAARNSRQAQQAGLHAEAVAPAVADDWQDIRPVLDEEVNRLPSKYRRPFVSCYLEGKSTDETAAELGCPRGTVATRVAWARERLRARLSQRGVALTAGALTVLLSQRTASAGVEASLVAATVQAGMQWSEGAALAGSAARAGTLAQVVLAQMQAARLKLAAVLAVFLGVLGTAATALTYQALTDGSHAVRHTAPRPSEEPAKDGPWLVGTVVALSPDGQLLTVAERAKFPGDRERLFPMRITDTTRVTYRLNAPEEARPEVGYWAMIWVERGAPDRATQIQFLGRREVAWPQVAGQLAAVTPDGLTITIAPTPRSGQPVPVPRIIRIAETTEVKFLAVGEDQARLLPGRFHAEVWLETGLPETAARLKLSLPETRPDRQPTLSGVVQRVSTDQRTITLLFNPHDSRTAFDLQLAPETVVAYYEVGPGGARIRPEYQASVWYADAAHKIPSRLELRPTDPRPAFSGRVVGVADEGRRLNIERTEGKKTWTVDVLLGEKTAIVYRKVLPGGARPKTGYFAQVWYKEKSPGTVEEVWLTDESIP